jgi:Flp pilus assembly protein TadG
MRPVDDVARGKERRGGRLRAVHRDQRGMVRGFFMRSLFVFVILLVGVEEIGQVVLTQTHTSNAAGSAAQAAADDYAISKNAHHAETIALATMASEDPKATMTAFSVGQDGAVTVTASESATTYLIQHLPFLKKYQVQTATVTEIHSLA